MNLRELQTRFAWSLRGGPAVKDLDGRGMAVYTNGYRSALVASMGETYARTRLWLGNGAFEEAAEAYVAGNPPAAWTLDSYGEGFVAALDQRYPADPEIGELAWLDWHMRCAATAEEVSPIGLDDLVSTDWDHTEFRFVPSLRFRRTRSNAAAIWRALSDETMPPAGQILDAGAGIRVWLQGVRPRCATMLAPEVACLDLAVAGGDFGELCASLTRLHEPDTAARQAGALLRSWVEDGLVQALKGG